MGSHMLTDKGLSLEARWFGWAANARAFPEPGATERYAPDRSCRIEHVHVRMWIDPAAPGLRTSTTLLLRPLAHTGGHIELDLDEMEVQSVVDAAGKAVDWSHFGATLALRGLPTATTEVTVEATGRPSRGLYFTGPTPAEPQRPHMAWTQCQDEDAHRLFPCHDHPGDRHPWEIEVYAPTGQQVVSNGRLVATEDGPENTTRWRWVQSGSMPAYLLSVVVGPLDLVEDQWDGIPVRYWTPAGQADADTVRRVFGKTPRMVAFFSQRLGVRYPWDRYDQVVVHDFIFGGMENVCATTLTDLVLTDERAALDWDAEDLIAHELAHQWFGDLVTCQDWSQAWLNESWATYCEFLWKTEDLGADEAAYALWSQQQAYQAEDASRYRRSIVDYRFKNPIDLFDRHLYEKGAVVLHTLRHQLGDDTFFSGVQAYLEAQHHGPVHTRDFQRAMESTSGRNLDRFFRTWILQAGHPELSVHLGWADGLLTVDAKQTQTAAKGGAAVPACYRFGLPLVVHSAEGVERFRLPLDRRQRTFSLPCATRPTHVEVDAGYTALAAIQLSGPRDWLVAALTQQGDVIGRIRAARGLAKEGSVQAKRALAAAAQDDPFWGVRAQLAGVLQNISGQSVQDALIAGAASDPHPKARLAFVDALSKRPDPGVAEALFAQSGQPEPSLQVQGARIRALGRLRSPRAQTLAQDALGTPSWGASLQCRALEALGHSRDPAMLPLLQAWTTEDRPNRARATACAALARLADEVPEVRLTANETLVALAKAAPFRVRLAAIGALGTVAHPGALGPLARIHASDGDGRVQRMAWEASRRVQKGRSSEAALGNLREAIDQLQQSDRKLADQVDRLQPIRSEDPA